MARERRAVEVAEDQRHALAQAEAGLVGAEPLDRVHGGDLRRGRVAAETPDDERDPLARVHPGVAEDTTAPQEDAMSVEARALGVVARVALAADDERHGCRELEQVATERADPRCRAVGEDDLDHAVTLAARRPP